MTSRCITVALMIATGAAARAVADPPERVARISFIGGTVSFRSASAAEWSPATVNYPITIGDHVWADTAARVELQMGTTAVSLDAMSAMSVLNLDYQIVQIRLAQGTAIVRVRERQSDETIEVDTPNGAITLLSAGLYRFDVPPAADATTVTVRGGDAEIATAASASQVRAGQSVTISGVDPASETGGGTVRLDDFEDWVLFRERSVDALTTVQYVPRAVVGYDDLDRFGTWRVVADYGPVWAPRVPPGWAPYRFGHWAWIDPWGWTWIDDARWGFAPFHYGRWAYVRGAWVWVPGTMVKRPVYAPALVAFVGGPNWRIGAGAPVGWFPLGPHELFVPVYPVSRAYVVAVNRSHVATPVNVSVTNIAYVNRPVPGALTVVPRDTFVHGRAIAPAAVRVTPEAVKTAAVVGHTAPSDVAPVAGARPIAVVAAPPPTVTNRTVVVRTVPATTAAVPAVRRAAPIVPARSAPPPVTSTAPPAPRPGAPAVSPAPAATPAQPSPPQPAKPVVPGAGTARPAPDRAAANLAARQAQERMAIAQRHAAEREALRTRQVEEMKHAANGPARADMQARHVRERDELEARQKSEREQMQQRHESERRGRQ